MTDHKGKFKTIINNDDISDSILIASMGYEQAALKLSSLINIGEHIVLRWESCRILAMVKATDAVVECIWDGLKQPSTILPFLELHLLIYGSMRDEPALVELQAKIEG